MNLYLDSSALVKRYVAEEGSDVVRAAMRDADGWFACRVGFVESVRAIGLSAGPGAIAAFRREWPAFAIIELDEALAEHAAKLTQRHDLRSLDALHLASALLIAFGGLTVATWDRRLHAAAQQEGLAVLPEAVEAGVRSGKLIAAPCPTDEAK